MKSAFWHTVSAIRPSVLEISQRCTVSASSRLAAADVSADRSRQRFHKEAMASSQHENLPTLEGAGVSLRELRPSDAVVLFSLLTEDDVVQFISPPPSSPDGFERFINWSIAERKGGRHFSLGVIPQGLTEPVGVFQLRVVDRASNVAEWGFVLASQFWGTGLFPEAARLMLEFAFDALGIHRLEARAAVPNGRGNGALAKVCAVHEVRLRASFKRRGVWFDQMMWSILEEDWRAHRQLREQDTHEASVPHQIVDDTEGRSSMSTDSERPR
jgi:RimJ/RimL family protein N-acetyltransferase